MKKCLLSIAALAVVSVSLYFYGKSFFVFNESFLEVRVHSNEVYSEVDEKFLSVALDVSFMRCLFHKLDDRQWEKLEQLSSLLSPAYLRFGGTDADRAIFLFNSTKTTQFIRNNSCENNSEISNVTITDKDWIKLNKFSHKSKLSLIVDLNVLLRKNSGWDSSNAEALIEFSEENGFHLDFQLGNEPNSFLHVFNTSLTGKQLANDFYTLKKILNSTVAYRKSKLIGPDVTRPKKLETDSLKYLDEFLKKDVVDVVSWHQYYLNGHSATLEDFVNPNTFDLLPIQIKAISETVRRHSLSQPIWISETSSAYGGGAPGLSDRFAASFLWLDKLGMAAKSNMSVVVRQSLFKDHYALIDKQLLPTPDFWISVLYKNLIGREVIQVELMGEKSDFLRFYSHCIATNTSINGSLVIYGMNFGNKTELFVPTGFVFKYPVYSYVFKPRFNNLTAKEVLLNGRMLVYNETVVEDMLKTAEMVKVPLVVPSYSIGFWVFNESSESVCQR